MDATSAVSGRRSNVWRTRRVSGWFVACAALAIALWIGEQPVVAQTGKAAASGTSRVSSQAPANEPNATQTNEPNAPSTNTSSTANTAATANASATPNTSSTATSTEPNQTSTNEPNTVPNSKVNPVPNSEPNQTPVKEPNEGQFNASGNILIADQLNHRVIEVDPKTHAIVWQFGDGNSVAGPKSVVAPHDAQRVGDWTLICGTGASARTDPNAPAGSPDNRVLLVDCSGKIIWQYGQAGVAGADANQLNMPMCATFLPYGHILIADQGNQRVIEVSLVAKQVVWQYGTTGTSGTTRNYLHDPTSALRLDNGNILIADQGNNRVIEVTRSHRIAWRHGAPEDSNALSGPAYACRLPNNHTLITDSGHNRVLEVDRRGRTIMEFATNKRAGSVADPLVWRAVRLKNGNTLISDQFNQQVIEIDSKSNIVFTQGAIGTAGSGFNQLNSPCDAKVIGDYTGLTPPSLDSYCQWYDGAEVQNEDDGGPAARNRDPSWNHARGRF